MIAKYFVSVVITLLLLVVTTYGGARLAAWLFETFGSAGSKTDLGEIPTAFGGALFGLVVATVFAAFNYFKLRWW